MSDGDWDPASSRRAQRLYDNRFDLLDDLSAGPASDPAAYRQQALFLDAEECSESAALLLNPVNGVIVIPHQNPGC